MSSAAPLKILSIAHPAVSRDAGRLRYYPLGRRVDVDVHLVVPAVWHQFGRIITADPSDDPGITVHVMPIRLPKAGPMSWYLHFYPGLRRLIRELDPDVVHLWEEPWSVVAMQARLLKGRAVMVMEVDQNILKRLPPPFEFIRKQVLVNTDHVLSRSPDATAVVRARGYDGPVSSIGYGVDITNFRHDVAPLLPPVVRPAFRIGYVGRLVVEKGLDDALEAMAHAKTPVTLALMGEGPHEGVLRQRVAELGLIDRVSFRGWGKPVEVARFLRSLDALILLTRTTHAVKEQFGRVITEAQACGVPVIGSTGGAIPDVTGEGGWIVPESDPDALAALIDRIAVDPSEMQRRSQAALANVMSRFTYEAVADDLASACFAAVARRRGG
ncbi:MAG: glycosyl transferase family 1 [Bradyrhizobiaceae bacterium PARB1]|nr:MAG: glycosyl transferase family 1 [Bradyrhizobiaceae bacterium PARB1]